MDINLGQMVAAAAFASAITALSIVVLKPLAKHIGLVDCPNGRKQHEGEIPLIGGIAIFLGLIAGLSYSDVMIPNFDAFVTAVSLLFVVGIIDDFLDIPAVLKLVAQLVAALILVFWADMHIEGLADLFYSGRFELGSLSVPITIIAVVGYTNAVNMSDGVDGLAGSIALIAALSLFLAAYFIGYKADALFLGVFAASLFVFLIFNARHPLRQKAGIFLGDAGSLLCGFIIAWFIIKLAITKPRAIDAATALWIVGVPFIDMVAVMIRRMWRGKSPFSADREHFHHLLLTAGFSPNQTVLIIAGISTLFSAVGIIGLHTGIPSHFLFYSFVFVFLFSLLMLFFAWRTTRLLSHIRKGLKPH